MYGLISAVCARRRTDAFSVTLPLVGPVICLRGADTARLFYRDDLFERAGAAPVRAQMTLVGDSGVQLLDGESHRRRKAMITRRVEISRVRPLPRGRVLADLVPGAGRLVLERTGHQLPRRTWDTVITALPAHTAEDRSARRGPGPR